MSKRWIVTGANGYLGGEVSKGLFRSGGQVFAVVRLGSSLNIPDDIHLTRITYDELPTTLSKGDVVIHCAGKVGSKGSWKDFENVNKNWSVELYEQAVQCGADCFVYVSSVAAVGYRNRSGIDAVNEKTPADLLKGEFYGRSKYLAERALREHAQGKSTRLIILRPGLIYGKREIRDRQTWFRRGVVVTQRQRIPLVHIDSVVDAIDRLVSKCDANDVYFVVDEEQPTARELNDLKLKYGLLQYLPWRVGRAGFWLFITLRSLLRFFRRTGGGGLGFAYAQYCFDTRCLRYSTEKLRSETGWVPKISLAEGLKSCAIAQKTDAREPVEAV